MKHLLILVFILAFVLNSTAQNTGPAFSPSELKTKTYKLSGLNRAPAEKKLPFSKIKVVDNRFDTSKIGLQQEAFSSMEKMYLQNLCLKNLQQ